MSDADGVSCNSPIIHVLVVGFHHKKGCIVEYAYPPVNEDGGELPDPWKHLPTLALPDGAHNFEEDTIYFHLPSLGNPKDTVFGISCYRQMNAERLLRRSSDITRETVQKSVCVLSKAPLYGLIQAKLELITHAYFDERDFSKVSLLEETFKNLNSSLPKDLLDGQQAFLGLSVRDFVLRFKHKILLLFKLLLLERKVLFYKAPVKSICCSVLTLCSLIPGMLEKGLTEAVTSFSSRRGTPQLTFTDQDDYLEVSYNHLSSSVTTNKTGGGSLSSTSKELGSNPCCAPAENKNPSPGGQTDNKRSRPDSLSTERKNSEVCSSQNSSDTEGDSWVKINHLTPDIGSSGTSVTSSIETRANEDDDKLLHSISELLEDDKELNNSSLEFQEQDSERQVVTSGASTNGRISTLMSSLRGGKSNGSKTLESDALDESVDQVDGLPNMVNVADIESSECGLPLSIFSKGMLCHPYLSLPFLEVLSDLSIRGFIVGATNILFKQKKHLFDVIVEVDEGKIEVLDPELKRQLSLTTEDLRLADLLVRRVMEDRQDVFLDGTGWEGGDEWLRSQFKLYLLSAMRTSMLEASAKECESFNPHFMSAWKSTHNYKIWSSGSYSKVSEMSPGHPFQGQLSMADMKLKFSHTMQNTERGRRINTAVLNTGKAVVQTGKVVGGALTNAKSAVSSWLSSFSTQVPPETQDQDESIDSATSDQASKEDVSDA